MLMTVSDLPSMSPLAAAPCRAARVGLLVELAVLLALSLHASLADSSPSADSLSPFTNVLNQLVNDVLGVQQFQVL